MICNIFVFQVAKSSYLQHEELNMFVIYNFLTSKLGQIIAGVAAVTLLLLGVRRSGKKAARDEAKLARLKANKETRERIDNAKPAKDAAAARVNLADRLRRRGK